MEGRKWEELNMDCLVNVLGRLGMESLLLDVPFVCKSWYKATHSPLCWQHINFFDLNGSFKSRLQERYRCRSPIVFGLIKLVGTRSAGCAISLVLPPCRTEEEFIRVAEVCVAEVCPALKYLMLPSQLWNDISIIPRLVSKFKNLQTLRVGRVSNLEEFITQAYLHCKNLIEFGISCAYIGEAEARTIVSVLKDIKYLVLWRVSLEQENLLIILKGCKKLERFDVRGCEGFVVDDEILSLASHIPTFLHGDHDYSFWFF